MFDQLTENDGEIEQVDVEIKELQINEADPLNINNQNFQIPYTENIDPFFLKN